MSRTSLLLFKMHRHACLLVTLSHVSLELDVLWPPPLALLPLQAPSSCCSTAAACCIGARGAVFQARYGRVCPAGRHAQLLHAAAAWCRPRLDRAAEALVELFGWLCRAGAVQHTEALRATATAGRMPSRTLLHTDAASHPMRAARNLAAPSSQQVVCWLQPCPPAHSHPANACQWLPTSEKSRRHSLYCEVQGQPAGGAKPVNTGKPLLLQGRQASQAPSQLAHQQVEASGKLQRTFWCGSKNGSRWVSFRLGGRLSTAVPLSVLSLVHALELSGVEGSGGVEAHLGQRMVALGRSTSVWPCREGSGGRCKNGAMQTQQARWAMQAGRQLVPTCGLEGRVLLTRNRCMS